MFQVRRVRVKDATLIPIHYPAAPTEAGEGVLLKAESPRFSPHESVDKSTPTYASVHMNMGVQPAKSPGTNLLLALLDAPRSNVFNGGFNGVAMQGRASLPQEGNGKATGRRFYTLTIMGSSMGEDEDIEITFAGSEEAADFIRTLIHHWFGDSVADEDITDQDVNDALSTAYAYSSALPDMGSEEQRLREIHRALTPVVKRLGLV